VPGLSVVAEVEAHAVACREEQGGRLAAADETRERGLARGVVVVALKLPALELARFFEPVGERRDELQARDLGGLVVGVAHGEERELAREGERPRLGLDHAAGVVVVRVEVGAPVGLLEVHAPHGVRDVELVLKRERDLRR